MGKEMIKLRLSDATYKPLGVDIIGKLFEGLAVKVQAGSTGMPYINLGRKLTIINAYYFHFSDPSRSLDIRVTFAAILCFAPKQKDL
jgi:hypothetical protein